jgi:glycosyltransferase involved in cell wall biosynthesis
MTRILFDARWVRPRMTGVGRYAYSLLRSPVIPRGDCGIILPEGSPFAAEFAGYRIFPTRTDLTRHPATDWFEQTGVTAICRRNGYEAFVSFEGRVPALHRGIATFPVIHDLSFRLAKGSHTRKYAFFLGLHARLNRAFATRIIAVSETVRSDLARELGVPAERVLVVPNAGSRLDEHAPLPVPGLEGRYFLMVGVTNPRKDLPTALAALAKLRERFPGTGLAVTGDADLIGAALRANPVPGVLNLGFVAEGTLRALYAGAAGLVYPSRNEGFGIPLVDAVDAGCPVICSDIPVFREVMETGAFFFPPGDPAAMADRMGRVLAGGRPDAGLLRGKYSWDASARALLEGIDATLAGGS